MVTAVPPVIRRSIGFVDWAGSVAVRKSRKRIGLDMVVYFGREEEDVRNFFL
jgi:hypothetical protein